MNLTPNERHTLVRLKGFHYNRSSFNQTSEYKNYASENQKEDMRFHEDALNLIKKIEKSL